MLPKDLAGVCVEAEDAFVAGDGRLGEGIVGVRCSFIELAIHDIDVITDNGGAGIAQADRRFPKDVGFLGELIDDSGFAIDAVTAWSAPLGPVVGQRG